MPPADAPRSGRLLQRALDAVERAGNRLPDPVTIFVALAGLTLVASWAAAALGLSVTHPVSGKAVAARNLLSADGIRLVLAGLVTNFTGFAPLGTVLTAMLGIGVAERSGLLGAVLRVTVAAAPRWAIPPALVFVGVNSSAAVDAGYVVLTPLAALLYDSLGRHPLAGVATVFAGVAGGFSANLLVTVLDPLLGGLTQEAARVLDAAYVVPATANWWFMIASVFLLTPVGWFVSVRIVEPRLGPWRRAADATALAPLDRGERRGLAAAGVALAGLLAGFALLALPAGAPLRDPATGGFEPLQASLVGLLMIAFLVPGLAYGAAAGTVRSDRDVARMMADTMAAMGPYVVLAFFAGQFIAFFRQSELGLIVAIGGADLLRALGLTGSLLVVAFIAVTAAINLVMSSASAKWAAMAPVFVPMFMTLGWSPEVTQAIYRVGDSITNCITPLNPYFPMVVMAVERWVPDLRLGTFLAAMLPFAVAFWLAWTAMTVVWIGLGLPLGPGIPLHFPAP